ncbi:MAG: YbaB/EbfC family nucleoid-associated protein [Spirochaetaceae bacterium]|jgi:DNA-binding YbaB/EbfC family protein|nr:YbaB/EbfC family nucleoid-associated protein [Spirochaetaceae bacterium]
MPFNPLELLKNPQALREQFAELQEQLRGLSATGSSGGNIVKVTVNGQLEMIDLEIDPVAVDPRDIPMLQDLILAASHDAQRKVQEAIRQRLGPMFGGMNLPGITL